MPGRRVWSQRQLGSWARPGQHAPAPSSRLDHGGAALSAAHATNTMPKRSAACFLVFGALQPALPTVQKIKLYYESMMR